MRIVTAEDIHTILDMKSCVRLMKETLAALSLGDAKQVLRTAMRLEDKNILGVMPAYIKSKKITGTKILTVFPDNYKDGLPSHQGKILVFETDAGTLKAIVDAEAITGIRTAAVSAAATDLLANKNAEVLALLGAGLQARKHLEAVLTVRSIKEVRVWDVYCETAEKFAQEMSGKFNISITACKTAEYAAKDADIICTVTPSKTPVLNFGFVKKGAHINAVGACTPDARELDTSLIKNSLLYVDSLESATNEAGDYLIPLRENAIGEDHILGELGDLILGKITGRTNPGDITVFKALGLAVEDLAAADYVIECLKDSEVV